MTTAAPIRNRFKRSPLPPNWDIAAALRNGADLDEIAATYGVKRKTITKRLQIAGWDAEGNPIPPWLEDNPGIAVCKRCGRERKTHSGRPVADWCKDCKDVATYPRGEGNA